MATDPLFQTIAPPSRSLGRATRPSATPCCFRPLLHRPPLPLRRLVCNLEAQQRGDRVLRRGWEPLRTITLEENKAPEAASAACSSASFALVEIVLSGLARALFPRVAFFGSSPHRTGCPRGRAVPIGVVALVMGVNVGHGPSPPSSSEWSVCTSAICVRTLWANSKPAARKPIPSFVVHRVGDEPLGVVVADENDHVARCPAPSYCSACDTWDFGDVVLDCFKPDQPGQDTMEVLVVVAMPPVQTKVSERAWEEGVVSAVAAAVHADRTLAQNRPNHDLTVDMESVAVAVAHLDLVSATGDLGEVR